MHKKMCIDYILWLVKSLLLLVIVVGGGGDWLNCQLGGQMV